MGLKARPKTTKSAGLKTRPTNASAASFIAGLADNRRQTECKTLVKLMSDASGERPVMWGSSIVGFGSYHYKTAAGSEGDWPRTGFAPRQQALTVYCMPGFSQQADLLEQLGPHKTGVSCLYIKRLDDVDLGVLRDIIARSLAHMTTIYGG